MSSANAKPVLFFALVAALFISAAHTDADIAATVAAAATWFAAR